MKKKSMSTLASLAPRRRGRGNNRDKPAESQEAAKSVPADRGGLDRAGQAAVQGNERQTVDRLADDLLESTIFNHPNGLASHPSVLLCGSEPVTTATTRPANSTMAVDYHDPVVVFPSGERAASSQPRNQPLGADDVAPPIPRRSSRRKANRAKNVDTSAGVDESVPKRSFPHSKTTMLDAGKKQDVFLPGSTTAPLGGLSKQVDERMPNPNNPAVNPNIINDKVTAMLAATEALKPPGSQTSTPSTSKPSRFGKNKLVSKFLDIFHPKPATPESKIRGKISAPIALTTCDLPNPAAHYHIEEVEQVSPVSSIEIRLNEGQNLNNQKVRSIVGGRILRKPVPDDGRSLRSGGSSDDPFSEPHEIFRTPTPFEHRLKSSLDSGSIPPVPNLNPFDSEDFDADLEGILSEKPLCASTPRVRNDKQAVPLESPSQRYAKADDRHLTVVGESRRGGLNQKNLKLDLEGIRLFHDQPDLSTKKHPSPSKDDLHDLETQFRAYAIAQIKSAPAEEREELVNKFAGLIGPNALTPRDKNIPMKARSAKDDTVDDFSAFSERKYTRDSSVLSTNQSRIPRPVEPTTKIRSAPRFGYQRLPTNPDALDIDELQM